MCHVFQGEHKCIVCGKRFKDKQGLNVHVRRIHMPRKYGCGLCGQRFQQKFNLKRHIRGRHSDYVASHGMDQLPQLDDFKLRSPSPVAAGPDDQHLNLPVFPVAEAIKDEEEREISEIINDKENQNE